MKTLLQKLGTVVGINIAKTELEATYTIYNELANRLATSKPERKTAAYNANVLDTAIKAIDKAQSALNRDLKHLANGPEAAQFVNEAISHNEQLFYQLINLDFEDQKRVSGLMEKIKRDKLKAA